LREASEPFLGEDEVVADGDLEDTTAALDQLRLDAELLLDLSRQTGGAGVVVSAGAVLDGDVAGHALLLSPPIIAAAAQDRPDRPLRKGFRRSCEFFVGTMSYQDRNETASPPCWGL
jgi:hypothetical protein